MFDIGYTVLFCIIASLLPTFPIGSPSLRMGILIFLILAQSNNFMERTFFIIGACFFVGLCNKKVNQGLF